MKTMQRILDQLDAVAHGSPSLEALYTQIQSNKFLRNSWFERWIVKANEECPKGLIEHIKFFSRTLLFFDKRAWLRYRILIKILASRQNFRNFTNNLIVDSTVRDKAKYFDTVEKEPLTLKQREAATSDEDATLVIAGAGTGKTSTIVAKIGLLIETRQCNPDEILAISFTNKSATELEERVKKYLDVDVSVSTFHKLGLTILAQSEGFKPTLAPFSSNKIEKVKFIQSIIDSLKEDEQFQNRLLKFLAYYRVQSKEIWNFESLSQYGEWLKSNKIISLDGKPKKSYQECVIANWLLLNGVVFKYEAQYEHATRTIDYRQYCPDFYLPDANIYIEHFGVNLDGSTAPFIDAEKYWQGIEWKREIHKKNHTKLIETYSWEHSRGVWEENLAQWLTAYGCHFSPIPIQEALDLINESGIINGFAELVANFLTLYKGNGNELYESTHENAPLEKERETAFLDLFYPIYKEYENQNQLHQQIDFEDMITRATKSVERHTYLSRFHYILVDEFQDISAGRANLLRALQQSNKECALFAVGDDWQSIYRFAGSDIGAMTKFDRIFGSTRFVALDKTFRFDDQAIALSSTFILKNKAQIQKTLEAKVKSIEPSAIIYRNKNGENKPFDWSLEQIANQASKGASVLILERYRRHLPLDYEEIEPRLRPNYDTDHKEWTRLKGAFPSLSLSRRTIHSAKGLEADYAIVGLRGGLWGFPNQSVDDPLFNLLLTQADLFPFGEERRLFYVAITRSRNNTYIVCEAGADQSIFATELESGSEYFVSILGEDIKKIACPRCKSGVMLLRSGANGAFYGCSNFPLCKHTEQTCEKCGKGLLIKDDDLSCSCNVCGHHAKICPRCREGILRIKSGAFGPFYGCSQYKGPDIDCRYTESVPRQPNAL
jgi:DNA helicase-4